MTPVTLLASCIVKAGPVCHGEAPHQKFKISSKGCQMWCEKKASVRASVRFYTELKSTIEHRERLFQSDAVYLLEKILKRERYTAETRDKVASFIEEVAVWSDTRLSVENNMLHAKPKKQIK